MLPCFFEEGDKLVVLLSSLFPIRKTFLQTLDLRILRCYLRIVSGPKLRVFVLVQNAAFKIVIEPEFCLCKPLFSPVPHGSGPTDIHFGSVRPASLFPAASITSFTSTNS